MNYKYGVVVPHYNSLDGLERLLASIPQRADIQVVVTDDNSREVPKLDVFKKKFPDLNLEIFTNDSGVKGAGAARNIALQHIDSQYSLFADADDFYTEGAFDLLDKKLGDEDITYFSPISCCERTGEPTDRHETWANLVTEYLENNDEDIRYHFAVPWSKVYSTKFIQQHDLYFDQVIAWNDVMFSMISGHKAESVTAHTDAIYCVTKSEGTITGTFTPASVRSRFDVQMRRVEYIYKHRIPTESYSLYKLLKNFHRVMGVNDYKHVLGLAVQRKITLLPKRTQYYLRNPRQLVNRVIKSKTH